MRHDEEEKRVAGVEARAGVARAELRPRRRRVLAHLLLVRGQPVGVGDEGNQGGSTAPVRPSTASLLLAIMSEGEGRTGGEGGGRLVGAARRPRGRASRITKPFPVVEWYCPKTTLSLKKRRSARRGGMPFPPLTTSSGAGGGVGTRAAGARERREKREDRRGARGARGDAGRTGVEVGVAPELLEPPGRLVPCAHLKLEGAVGGG